MHGEAVRVGPKGALERVECVITPLQFPEHGAEVAERRRKVGHETGCLGKRGSGALHLFSSQPELSGLEVRGFPRGRDRQRALDRLQRRILLLEFHAGTSGRQM
jgi:hypothetical protein